MSYIIWKNKKSEDIKGLLICDLPPISKPKMRTSITEIDGLDGDRVSRLGYKSYTKTLSIALTRDYDINEIINYFNGESKLVLSNEPDKYYKAEIIDGVDYNRLINFKTATVKFHVQPYKYLLNEAPFVLNITNEKEFKVSNRGYEKSKPIITLYGTGIISISINGNHVFEVNMTDECITVDAEQEEAYFGSILKNRQMTGDFPLFNQGINIITWTGNLTKIEINPRSRWL